MTKYCQKFKTNLGLKSTLTRAWPIEFSRWSWSFRLKRVSEVNPSRSQKNKKWNFWDRAGGPRNHCTSDLTKSRHRQCTTYRCNKMGSKLFWSRISIYISQRFLIFLQVWNVDTADFFMLSGNFHQSMLSYDKNHCIFGGFKLMIWGLKRFNMMQSLTKNLDLLKFEPMGASRAKNWK